MLKRQRLELSLLGEATDRVPVSLWRHFPGDDQRAADLARSTVEFQRNYDWDFVNITPSNTYSVMDYGVQTVWDGDAYGRRTILKHPVSRSLHWTELRTLEPLRGETGKILEATNLTCNELNNSGTPVIVTVYSPLTQASQIAGHKTLFKHLRMSSDRLHTGLNIITESTLRFIEALRRTEIAGIFYIMDYADFTLMPVTEYQQFGLPYDQKIIDSFPGKWWLNILQLRGPAPMFDFAATYPIQGLNWDIHHAAPDLDQARIAFGGMLCTGFSAQQHLHLGTPAMIKDIARSAVNQLYGRRIVLAAGDVIPVTTPLSNLRAVREAVENIGVLS